MTESFTSNSVYNQNKYLNDIRDIYRVLSNNKDLTNNQKLDLCEIQRQAVKSYFKQILERVEFK